MRNWAASLAVLIFFAASLYWLGHKGSSSRVYGPDHAVTDAPVYVLAGTPDVYRLWKEKGFRGRVVLHVGRYLHFVPVDMKDTSEGLSRFPVETISLIKEYEGKLDHRNFLMVALLGNIAREVYNVLPPYVFRGKLEAARGMSGVRVSGKRIRTHHLGSRRTISDSIPVLEEPVLLNIDASYFARPGAAENLLKGLKASGIRVDMITLCLSEDSPDVTEAEREMLRGFASRLEGEGI